MGRWLADFRQDCRHALRLMRRTPQVSILMVLSLAIGIGANVTLVAATTHALLRPPPHIREPERVVRLLRVADDGQSSSSAIAAANYPRLLDIQRQATAFEGVAAHATRTMSIGRGANAMEVRASLVSAGFFSVLGVKAQLGRAFSEADGYPNSGQNGGAPLAVVSHTFWKRHLAGDVAAYGRSIRIGEILYTIVGVAPPGFRGVDAEEPDVWLPITVAAADPAAALSLDDRSRYSVAIVARLRSSVTRSLAEQQATAIWKQGDFAMNSSQAPVRIVAATLLRGRAPDAPREVRVMFWLVGVSALVLLITCANVANILLSRAVARRQETAVRLALGASPQRLARQMLAEGIILASAGAMAAVVVAIVSVPLLSTFVFGDVVDGGVVPTIALSAAIAGLGTAALISLAPAAQSLRYTQLAALRTAKPTWGHRGSHVRTALLIGQSAICMAMLIIAGLFALSLRRATSLDLGLDVDRTIRALVKLDGLMVPKEVVEATYAEMLRRVQAIPGVEGVALASSDPFAGGRAVAAHTLERDAEFFWPPSAAQIAIEAAVGEGFFRAVGARSLKGRDFEAGDNRSAPRVAIINSPLARILFPGKEALGECILLPKRFNDRGGSCVTVVGVLGGVWYASIANREKPMVYVPLAQRVAYDGVWRPQGFFTRVRGEPGHYVEAIRHALQDVRSDLPAVKVTLMRDVLETEIRSWRVGSTIFGLFGLVALIVAVVGLYSVVAYTVAQRRFEIAVRLSLGARPWDILLEVAGAGLGAIAAGLMLGALGALLVRRLVGPLLFQTTPDDPRLIVGTALLLFAVAFVATLFPTGRALRLDPAGILRSG